MKESCETDHKPKTIKEFVSSSRFWKPAASVLIGAFLGYLYYYFVGCESGSCSITSDPVSSILVGGALGLFMVNRPCKTC